MTSLPLDPAPRALGVECSDDELQVLLADGRRLAVPLAWFPRLAHASPRERAHFELMGQGQGIHWPAIDEDISVIGLIAGRPSVESKPAHV